MTFEIKAPGQRPSFKSSISFPRWTGALIAILILMAYTAIRQPTFLKWTNLVNIANEQCTVGILAVGMTYVIVLGGIDLSVGSLLALSGGLGVFVLNSVGNNHTDLMAVLAAGLVTIAIATTGGTLNGLMVAKGRLAPFIATLGMLLAYRSAAGWIANGGQFFSHGSELFAKLGRGIPIPHTDISRAVGRRVHRVVPFELPYSIIVWIVIAVIASLILNRARLGRYIIAIGNNERAARYSAINVSRVKIITYSLMGFLTGVAALMEAARYTSVNSANTGLLRELDAIAAAVIGGAKMEGGSGSIAGAVIGALLLGVIHNIIVMLGINSQAQGLVTGMIIIAAALAQRGKQV